MEIILKPEQIEDWERRSVDLRQVWERWGDPTDVTVCKILAGIACEVGQLDGTIAMLQEQRAAAERPEVRKKIHAQVLDEMSRRDGLYRALRIAADVVEASAAQLAGIVEETGAKKLADELRREASAERESVNV